MRALISIVAVAASILLVSAGWLFVQHGVYGFSILFHRAATTWANVKPDDPRLSPAVRLSLTGAVGVPGQLSWSEPRPGFEVAELPILFGSKIMDHLNLARIDPTKWRFSVRSDSTGSRTVDQWMSETGAALVVNGSYFDGNGRPDTPFLSEGRALGPAVYQSSHGAFVALSSDAHVVDLRTESWMDAFHGMQNALVSYPLLLDAEGGNRVTPSKWLAGRSFVGQDKEGRIIIGTTVDASLTLANFAAVLRASPLDLETALNLDGGPVACQSINLGDYKRRSCGPEEVQVGEGTVRLLQPLIGSGNWTLPVILAVFPK